MERTQVKSSSSSLPLVNLAIFGMGKIGILHFENLRKNTRVRVKYCVEEFIETVNYVRNKWRLKEGEPHFLKPSQADIVFNDGSVDAILICTPVCTHERIIIKALESGKAVFCEKPLSLDPESTRRCLTAAKRYSKPLMCGFNRRFDPGLKSLKSRVDVGEVGQLRVVRMVSRDPPHTNKELIKETGGIFHNCAIHDIDYVCWIVGEFPETVTTYGHTFLKDVADDGDYDTIIILMKFPSGAAGEIEISRHAVYGYDQRVEVFGSEGMLTCGGQRPTAVKFHDSKGSTADPIYFNFEGRYHESYVIEMEHFLNVVQGQENCQVPAESILASSLIASASGEAAKSGKLISLSWESLKNV